VEIFDVFGKKQKAARNSPPFMEGCQPQADGVVIDISHLPPGIYLLQIETEQGVVTKKVLKN
jgi:hypothetical protein